MLLHAGLPWWWLHYNLHVQYRWPHERCVVQANEYSMHCTLLRSRTGCLVSFDSLFDPENRSMSIGHNTRRCVANAKYGITELVRLSFQKNWVTAIFPRFVLFNSWMWSNAIVFLSACQTRQSKLAVYHQRWEDLLLISVMKSEPPYNSQAHTLDHLLSCRVVLTSNQARPAQV